MEKSKKEFIQSLSSNSKNTGSSEIQIGLLTRKINNLSEHFKKFKKDKHTSVGLLKAINKRKTLLEYLKKRDEESYNKILTKLNLRK